MDVYNDIRRWRKKYAEIQTFKRKGFKKARVAKILHINRETVTKYWDKPPDVFDKERFEHRARKPDVYKEQIVVWLTQFPDMTEAQIYDWNVKDLKKSEVMAYTPAEFLARQ